METWFSNLPLALQKNVQDVVPYFQEENVHLPTFFSKIKLDSLLKSVPLSSLVIYHRRKPKTLNIEKVLSKDKFMRVFLCKQECTQGKKKIKVVAKWFRFEERTVEEEYLNYEKLKSLNCPLPFFSVKYRLWNEPLLLLEYLEPLGEDEDYLALGRDVLEQLEYLHKFGVHNDIKVNNIMKRKEPKRYFLIDLGGVAKTKFKHGYLRWTWSENWTCQKIHQRDQVTTPKHDFIELGYCMNALYNLAVNKRHGDIRKNFTGKLKEYITYVRSIREDSISKKDYIQLKRILTRTNG
jgi:serine/threonine protein kinase